MLPRVPKGVGSVLALCAGTRPLLPQGHHAVDLFTTSNWPAASARYYSLGPLVPSFCWGHPFGDLVLFLALTASSFPATPIFADPYFWRHRYSPWVPSWVVSFSHGLNAGRVFFAAVAEVQWGYFSYPPVGVAGGLVDDRARRLLRCLGAGSVVPCFDAPPTLSLRGSGSPVSFSLMSLPPC